MSSTLCRSSQSLLQTTLHNDETGRPDWANFRLLGCFFTFGSFLIITEEVKNRATFYYGTSYLCINFDKKGLGYILGDFFTNSSGHPGS
jgi:hypothetical protein